MAAAVLASAAWAAEPAPSAASPLDRPAMVSELASQAPLLALARAGKRLVAVGERGHVLLSDDAGASWRQVPVPVSTTLTAVAFADERSGVAVGHGGVVLRTEDAGGSWTRVLDGREIARMVLERAQRDDPAALKDAQRLVEDGPDKPLLDVRFADAKRGLAVGAFGLVLATDDGGRSWTPLTGSAPARDKRHLYAALPTPTGWFLAGEQGAIYRSDDGGRTFSRLKSPYAGSFFGLATTGTRELIAFGLRGSAFRSADAGATWQRVDLPTKASLLGAASLPDGSMLLFDQVGGAWRSHDARKFAAAPLNVRFPVLAAQPSGKDQLVAVGLRGATRLALQSNP